MRLLDLLYPPSCIACQEPAAAEVGLCAQCWAKTHFIAGRACAQCGAPFSYEGGACEYCAQRPPKWRLGAAAALYEGAARDVVLGLKRADRTQNAAHMARWMARAGRGILLQTDFLVPTPLHWTRRLMRRNNQSAELARALATHSGCALAPDILRRPRATPSQGRKTASERITNMQGAFRVVNSQRVQGQRLTLIDDVMTTGATLNACAQALYDQGAQDVHVIVFARAVREDIKIDAALPTSNGEIVSKGDRRNADS